MTLKDDLHGEILRGEVDGHRIMTGLGERESIGTTAAGEDIWRGNELAAAPTSHVLIPTPAAAGEQMTLVSESTADNGATATGVLTVDVEYLDAEGDEQTETVTLNGQTPVDTVATNIRFVQVLHSRTVGSGKVAAGHIVIYKKGTATLVYSMIAAGGNLSLVPHRMVPRGKNLYLREWYATEGNNKRAAVRIRSTDHHGELFAGTFLFKGVLYLNQSASGPIALAEKVPALSIVKVTAWATAINAEVSTGWLGVLVDD